MKLSARYPRAVSRTCRAPHYSHGIHGVPDPVPAEICLIRLSCSHVSGDNFIEDFTCLVKRNLNNDKRRSLQSTTKMRADRNGPCDPFDSISPCPMKKLQVVEKKAAEEVCAEIKNCGCRFVLSLGQVFGC